MTLYNKLLTTSSIESPVGKWNASQKFILENNIRFKILILVQHLIARRTGYRDPDEPTGILSHHLAMNDATWGFVDELFGFLEEHPAAEFVGASEIWR